MRREFCAGALMALSCVPSVRTLGLADTVAWYRFEEGMPGEFARGIEPVKDSGPHAMHGTPRAGASVEYVNGIAPDGRVALDLNDPDDWVFVPDSPELQFTKSLTLAAWVCIRGYQTSAVGNFIIFRGDTRGGMDPYQLSIDSHKHELRFMIYGFVPGQGPSLQTVSAPFRWLNEPVHVAGVLDDATGSMALYANGELLASKETPVRSMGPLNPAEHPGLGIGGFYDGKGSFSIDGVIDEVRISDAALKQSQFLCGVRPRLAWSGNRGFEQDGVSPDSGAPRTNFMFEVRYIGPDDPLPTVKVKLRRDGDPYRTVKMSEAPTKRGDGEGHVFRAFAELGADVWEYQFEASGPAGKATGDPTEWRRGPEIEGPGRS